MNAATLRKPGWPKGRWPKGWLPRGHHPVAAQSTGRPWVSRLPRLAAILGPLPLLLAAWHFHHPLFYSLRYLETPILTGLPLALLLGGWRRLPLVSRLLLIAVLLLTAARALEYRLQKETVLAAGPSMETVGQHFIVGYSRLEEVQELAARGLIGGIYLTRRNVRGRSFADVAGEIAALQAIRQRAELPPLIVAADQEGGAVSHLSPLLEAMPPLASLADAADPTEAARHYGERQGQALAALGITLNFGPVVDLKPAGKTREDRFSNIPARAIAADPARVTEIAGAYLDGLATRGVAGTLKHFPGLGRIATDTHLFPAALAASPPELAEDWQPFRTLGQRPGAAIMLGHVTLRALDAQRAASHSPAAIGLLREQWGYDGLLLTDDLNMGAVYSKGIGQVAGEALAAGSDYVLVTYDPRQIYRALYGAAQALEERKITPLRLNESKERMRAFPGSVPRPLLKFPA